MTTNQPGVVPLVHAGSGLNPLSVAAAAILRRRRFDQAALGLGASGLFTAQPTFVSPVVAAALPLYRSQLSLTTSPLLNAQVSSVASPLYPLTGARNALAAGLRRAPAAARLPHVVSQPQPDTSTEIVVPQPPPLQVLLTSLGNTCRERNEPYVDVTQYDLSSVLCHDERDALRGGTAVHFPEKLHMLLNDESSQDVVTFLPHGRAFCVNEMNVFVEEILPKHFKQTKWCSFSRQLNLYGFKRVRRGPDVGSYYHELFLRNRPSLCMFMRRVGIPGVVDRRRKEYQKSLDGAPQRRGKKGLKDPDFYSMPPVFEFEN